MAINHRHARAGRADNDIQFVYARTIEFAQHLSRLGFHLPFVAWYERNDIIEDVKRGNARIPRPAGGLFTDQVQAADPVFGQGFQRHHYRHDRAIGIGDEGAASPAAQASLDIHELQVFGVDFGQ